jgi:6-phosphogluconolactonase
VRLTLTLPALRQAAEIYFLLAGADKARAFERTLAAERDPKIYPAASLASGRGAVVWWVDAAAATLLPKPLGPQSTEVGR